MILQGNYEERHYFALAIVNGFLEFRFSMGGQPVVIRFADYLIFDQNHQNHSQIESSGEHEEAGESNGKKNERLPYKINNNNNFGR